MKILRLLAVTWWLQLKMRSRSAFDGILSLLWPLFFATTVFLMFRGQQQPAALVSAAVGASVMGIWASTSTTAANWMQTERLQGTLELLVAAPAPLPVLILPVTLSMATIGGYSMLATLLWGRLAFGIDVTIGSPVGFAVSVLVTIVATAMLGFLLAMSAVRYRAAWALGSALEVPVWLICGFLVPLSALPDWVRPISWVLAPTWGMAAVRAASNADSPVLPLLACAGLAGAYGLGGSLLARRLVDSARTRATLALA